MLTFFFCEFSHDRDDDDDVDDHDHDSNLVVVVVVLHSAGERLQAQLFNVIVLHSLHITRLKLVLHSLLCHMFRLALTCACVMSACRLVRNKDDDNPEHLVQ